MFCWSGAAEIASRDATARGVVATSVRGRGGAASLTPREPKRISRRETNAKSRRARGSRAGAREGVGARGEHRGGGAGGDGRGARHVVRCPGRQISAAKVTWTARRLAEEARRPPSRSATDATCWRLATRRARSTAPILARASSHARVRNPAFARLRAAVVLRARVRRVLVVVAPDTRPIVPARRFEALRSSPGSASPERRQHGATTTLTLGFGAAAPRFQLPRARPRARKRALFVLITRARALDTQRRGLRAHQRASVPRTSFPGVCRPREIRRAIARRPRRFAKKSRKASRTVPHVCRKSPPARNRRFPLTPFPSTIRRESASARGAAHAQRSALLLGATFAFPAPPPRAWTTCIDVVERVVRAPGRTRDILLRRPAPERALVGGDAPGTRPRRRSSPPPTPRLFRHNSRNGRGGVPRERWRCFFWRGRAYVSRGARLARRGAPDSDSDRRQGAQSALMDLEVLRLAPYRS